MKLTPSFALLMTINRVYSQLERNKINRDTAPKWYNKIKSIASSEDDIDDIISFSSMKTIDFMSNNLKTPSKPTEKGNKSQIKESKAQNLLVVPSIQNSTPLGLVRKARIRESRGSVMNIEKRNLSQPSFHK